MAPSSRRFIPLAAQSSTPLIRPRSPTAPDQEPPVKRVRTDSATAPVNVAKLHKGFKREMRNLVDEARSNTVKFTGFNYATALGKNAKQQRDTLTASLSATVWDDAVARMAVSDDGVPLVAHFPGAMKETSTTHLFNDLVDFARSIGKLPKCAGADKTQDAESSYKVIAGQIAGIFKMVKAWHAIGHKYDQPTVSRDILKSGKNFNASLSLMSQLHLVSHRVNDMIENVDPEFYDALVRLKAEAERLNKFLQVIGSDDPLLMEGWEIMFNRQTPLHSDNSDPKRSWAALVVVGKFTGGALYIPCLNLRMSYTDGTMIMVRGRILPHEVEAFLDGQRICIAHFTHQSLWDACNISPP